jgi:hypothetical protein
MPILVKSEISISSMSYKAYQRSRNALLKKTHEKKLRNVLFPALMVLSNLSISNTIISQKKIQLLTKLPNIDVILITTIQEKST